MSCVRIINVNKDEDYYLREGEKARAAAAERERASVQARAHVTINYHIYISSHSLSIYLHHEPLSDLQKTCFDLKKICSRS